MNEFPTENLGVREGSGTKSLWAGGTIPYEVRLETGDWRPYLVPEEHQYSDNVDTMGCVSFSLTNDLEIQNKFLGRDVNFSDRFLAKMSNTTPQGNWLDVVAETAKKTGLVLETEWPAPLKYTWNEYYSWVPDDVVSKAVKQDILYEGVSPDKESLKYHLKQCPLQITIPLPYSNHAVVLVAIEGDTAYYFDSYPPYLKTINVNKISYALKVVLKGEESMILVENNGAYFIEGENGYIGISRVEFLQLLNRITNKQEHRVPKGTQKGIIESFPGAFIIKDN